MRQIVGTLKKEKECLVDWVILGLIVFVCFICYEHTDILHTGGSSISLLNGHILDFYDYNTTTDIVANNYLPTTYILFAIWNIPIRLLGLMTETTMNGVSTFVRLWYKLGTSVVYLLTTIFIYKICLLFNASHKNALIVAFLFASSPIAVYSQFIFSQYDILTTFFMVLGLYYYLKGKNRKFVMAFAVAVTCKYFALLVFVPLLLLREKKIWNIIKSCIGVSLVLVAEVLVYLPSEAFREGVFGFNATGYIFNTALNNGYQNISLAVVAWGCVCALAYIKNPMDKNEEFKWMIWLSVFVQFIAFGLSFWHPQWLLMAVPFWCLAIVYNKHSDILILLNLLMSLVFIVFSVNFWGGETFFRGGILKKYIPALYATVSMKELYVIQDRDLLFSIIVACMAMFVIFSYPAVMEKNLSIAKLDKMVWVRRMNYLGTLFFIIPSFLVLYMNVSDEWVFESSLDVVEVLDACTDDQVYEQVFVANGDSISGIALECGTYTRENDFSFEVTILDQNEETLHQQLIAANALKDNSWTFYELDEEVPIEAGAEYSIRIQSIGADGNNTVSLYRTQEREQADSNCYAVVNGVQQTYDLAVVVAD